MREFLDECDYLIHLVRCAIHKEQPQELPDTFDFERVYRFGVHHQVANIAFYSVEKLKNKPCGALYAKWQAHRNQAVILHLNQNHAAQEIRNSFQAADIPLVEVQGTRIKPIYPHPEYRTMSDIDFIAEQKNLSKAKGLLQNLGYQCEEIAGVEVNAFRAPNIHVELHTDYFPEDSPYAGIMDDPFLNTGVDGLYVYNILHIAKHYFWKGCGIRRVLDAYFLNQRYGNEINKKYVKSVFKAAGVLEFVAELSALANNWFGQEGKPVRSDMAIYILNSGLHGTAGNRLDNRLKKLQNDSGCFYKLRYFLGRIRGTKGTLYHTYPILKRHKILYPFCWLHRVFRALRPNKMKRLTKEVKTVMKKK